MNSLRNRQWYRAIVGALAMAFVLRALVPAGYMPNFAALAKGTFEVVICSAAGNDVVVDLSGTPGPAKHSGQIEQACAFTGLTSVALLALQPVAMVFGSDVAHVGPVVDDALPPARAGPPLGSRAPPVLA